MNHYFFMGMVIFLIVLSILCQIMIGVLYQNMINETDNMTATDNPYLKQCKMRFVNCYRLNGGVANVQIFTEKFINRLKVGKFSLVTVYHMSGQLLLVAILVAGIGIYLGITRGEGILNLLPYYIISLTGLYLYFSASSAIDINGKKKILKTNLVDYFENHMVNRLELLPESLRRLEEVEGDSAKEEMQDFIKSKAESEKKSTNKSKTKRSSLKTEKEKPKEAVAVMAEEKAKHFSKRDLELEELLKEFLS